MRMITIHAPKGKGGPTPRRTAASKLAALMLGLTCLVAAPMPSQAEDVGRASALRVAANQAPPGGTVSALSLGATIVRNAVLSTPAKAALEVTFADASKLTMGPDSEVVVDEFTYKGPGGGGSQAVNFGKGVFRFVSGGVPKENVKLNSRTATIGIRGTTVRTKITELMQQISVEIGKVFILIKATGQIVELNAGQMITIMADGTVGPIEEGQVEGCD